MPAGLRMKHNQSRGFLPSNNDVEPRRLVLVCSSLRAMSNLGEAIGNRQPNTSF